MATPYFTSLPSTSNAPIRLLRLPEVLQRVGISRAGLYRAIKEGSFPAAINIGDRAVAWVESEIDAWIQAKIHFSRIETAIKPGIAPAQR
jgi:prophage regulatory protein